MKFSPLLVAQVTDTHLLASTEGELLGLPTTRSFEAVVRQLDKLQPRPDLLLLTGDLSQDESLESYLRLRQCLVPLEIPTYWLPGNHDRKDLMHQALAYPPLVADKAFEKARWQFLLLDSAVPGQVYGRLSAEMLAWLDRQLLLSSPRPTAIALHHPPFAVGCQWIDGSRLENASDLYAVIDRHPQVQVVLCGHVHQDICYWRNDVCYLTTPSSSIQFKPNSDRFALDKRAPGFRLLWLYPDGRFETQVERVEFALATLNLAAGGY